MGTNRFKLIVIGLILVLLASPGIAYASDCPPGGALDCYGTWLAALVVVVAIVVIIVILVPPAAPVVGAAAAGAIEAGEVAAVGAGAAGAAGAEAAGFTLAQAAGVAAVETAEAGEATEAAEAGAEGIGRLLEEEGVGRIPDGPTGLNWPYDWPGSPKGGTPPWN